MPIVATPAAIVARPFYNAKTIQIGDLRLSACQDFLQPKAEGYCGDVRVPLNADDARDGTIAVSVEWIPARKVWTKETIVAVTGGPGEPSTYAARAFARLFAPLLQTRNLLLVDERGTGDSTPLDCPHLQRLLSHSDGPSGRFVALVAGCGADLNRDFIRRDGRSFVHASDLFSTRQAAHDLDVVLSTLHVPQIDLYGVSYGTFFAQTFARRYPRRVRSLVLDSAYPLDLDPFDVASRAEVRFAFDAVCARSAACAAAAPGRSLDRLRRLARRLSAAPLRSRFGSFDASDLDSALVSASVEQPAREWRELDAAARAWLDRNDGVPLGRLLQWSRQANLEDANYHRFSAAMAVANDCTDYVAPFDPRATLARRLRQFRAATTALPAQTFDPIAKRDVFGDPDNGYNECLGWPRPIHTTATSAPLAGSVPDIPALVMAGELDAITSPAGARIVSRRVGRAVRFVSLANAGHGTASSDQFGCAETLVRAFVRHPGAPLRDACSSALPEVRTVGTFPLLISQEPRAASSPGDRASTREARIAAVAVGAVGDTLATARGATADDECGESTCGRGLRGGIFVATSDVNRIAMHRIAFSSDSRVDGTIVVSASHARAGPGVVRARLRIVTSRGEVETLRIVFDERRPHALASIDGRSLRGARIRETVPAP